MSLYDIKLDRMDGSVTSLAELRDRVILVVNVASRCGLAPQYAQLEELQRRYAERGFTVVAFPSNQFFQELSTDEKVAEFCSSTYGVTFPVLARVKVNGRHTHPLYAELKKTADADGHRGRIRWNFEKFLVLPGGTVRRFAPRVEPTDPAIVEVIEAHLPT
ncbi:glutathione peroxidase [Isoptericola variabilis]|uniref:Glutathione peroxidase n=1 Tax=Isoptericola variabilis (strain 225) TaxID=743718 RepID=F6FWR8_ISOV2|nr:glutathione peroxidase [Isoptericola variabilis]AEG43490.1 Peroxiredoxin [Isoptericola variabilis 225]TWH32144.1 glutathione peroxidase [Isoptericola variabilis J7]